MAKGFGMTTFAFGSPARRPGRMAIGFRVTSEASGNDNERINSVKKSS
jgi:hypothetical protein